MCNGSGTMGGGEDRVVGGVLGGGLRDKNNVGCGTLTWDMDVSRCSECKLLI